MVRGFYGHRKSPPYTLHVVVTRWASYYMAPRVRLELTTVRLTAGCSAAPKGPPATEELYTCKSFWQVKYIMAVATSVTTYLMVNCATLFTVTLQPYDAII